MAAAAPETSLQEEIVCSICLDYFQEPVTTDCGHNFCRSCIASFWNGSARTCPQCRAPSLREVLQVNAQLANIVASVKQLRVSQSKPQEGDVCEEHDEKLKLFCKDDLKPICVVCDRSVHHRSHAVLPVAEALQEYKTSVRRLLEPLKRKREELEVWISEDKERCAQLKGKYTSQRVNIEKEFAELHQYLEAQKQSTITSLKKEEEGILKNIQQKITQLEEQHSSLQNLIIETENKSDLEFLKDVKNTVHRCENVTVQRPEADSPEDEKYLTSVLQQHSNLKKTIQEFRESFPAELEWRKVRSFADTVTLDPDTANPWLILSEDRKSVTFGDTAQDLPKTRERYDAFAFVLGRERLTSGRHYLEVGVGSKTSWTLGLCDESSSRKGNLTLEPHRGYWVLRLMDNKYRANTSPYSPVTPHVRPHVVGVFLDYKAGLLSFYNVEGRCLLFAFPQTLFPQTLRLCLSPSIVDGGRNTGALEILPVRVEE